MSLFLLKRLLTLLATLAGASVVVFLVLEILPGNAGSHRGVFNRTCAAVFCRTTGRSRAP